MNSAIGQLYSKYSSEYLQSHLEVRNIDPDDLSILRMVIERAKEYFKNRDTFMQNVDEILGE